MIKIIRSGLLALPSNPRVETAPTEDLCAIFPDCGTSTTSPLPHESAGRYLTYKCLNIFKITLSSFIYFFY